MIILLISIEITIQICYNISIIIERSLKATVSQAIDTINELKDDDEINNSDDDGFLYNGAGKKIAQIENYKKKSFKYDYIEEDENDENAYYAYDENNKKIGKVRWLK